MSKLLRVAALIDLPRSPLSGGHVKGWERRAKAAVRADLPLDLTIYFSGPPSLEELSPKVRLRQLPPVFSTARLKFLPYVPDNTDLAPYHPALAHELKDFDVIHTTDGFFAFAQTAERMHRRFGIPLVTSFHTDTPAYTRVFTHKTIETIFGQSWLAHKMIDDWQIPEGQERKKRARLRKHLESCSKALAIREEDFALAADVMGRENVFPMQSGVDHEMFGPHRADREGLCRDYGIPKDRILYLFVGRLDVGKNIYTVIEAMEKLIARGDNVHLVTAGVGPAEEDLRARLKDRVTVPGFIAPDELARLYASVDISVLASEVEIRSLVGIEAMVSGLPILVSAKSGVSDAFGHPSAMRIVDGGADVWAHAMDELARDDAARKQMSVDALAYADANFKSWEDVFKEDFFGVWQKAFDEKIARKG